MVLLRLEQDCTVLVKLRPPLVFRDSDSCTILGYIVFRGYIVVDAIYSETYNRKEGIRGVTIEGVLELNPCYFVICPLRDGHKARPCV